MKAWRMMKEKLKENAILNDIGDLIAVKILNPKIRHGLCLSQNWNYPSAQ
jgi:hypothetical protein